MKKFVKFEFSIYGVISEGWRCIATAAMSWVQIKAARKSTHVATAMKPTHSILHACLSKN